MVERNQFTNNTRGDGPREEESIFPHKCVTLGCDKIVEFDDEPWCFTHSPDEGSSLRGYSARRGKGLSIKHSVDINQRNIFDQ